MAHPSSTRYVVSKRTTGLGDCLVSLIAAWVYARCTGRTLIADWRFSRYLTRPKDNAFGYFFEPPGEIGGVPLFGDDRVGRLQLPTPYFPVYWTPRRIHRHTPRAPQDTTRSQDEAVDLVRSQADVPAPTVIFDTCMSSALPKDEESRLFLQALRPRQHLQAKIDEFWAHSFAGRTVIGLHIRHGNGGNIMSHGTFWSDELATLRSCAGTVARVREALGSDCAIFLCTDSPAVEELFVNMVSGVVTRTKYFAPAGKGELHDRSVGPLGADDALVEMYLLARCRVVVRCPPTSFFTHLASLIKPPLQPITAAMELALTGLNGRPGDLLRPAVVW